MKTITFSDDNADERYAGHSFDMFPVKFDWEQNAWVECAEGEMSHWGILSSHGVSPFLRDPKEFGIIDG